MNNITKIPLAILGACNKVMSMFIPIAVALLFINTAEMNGVSSIILLTVAILATLFRSIKVWID